MRILVVEDDPTISEPLAEGLRRAGFDIDLAMTGEAALAAGPTDLVLLDLGLPDLEGSVVCQRLRERSQVPIIVVSARGEEFDRVMLLELGADDYVVKPYGLRELVARIHAVARRAGGGTPSSGFTCGDRIEVGGLRIDRRTHEVTFNGNLVDLAPREFDLLVHLAADPGAVLTRDEIIRSVWDQNWWGSTKTLDVHIASLRKKLSPELIQTVRSVGYRLVAPDQEVTTDADDA